MNQSNSQLERIFSDYCQFSFPIERPFLTEIWAFWTEALSFGHWHGESRESLFFESLDQQNRFRRSLEAFVETYPDAKQQLQNLIAAIETEMAHAPIWRFRFVGRSKGFVAIVKSVLNP